MGLLLNNTERNDRRNTQFDDTDDNYLSDAIPNNENVQPADTIQRLLQLTVEAEYLAATAAETATKAKMLTQELIATMQDNNISPPRKQITGLSMPPPIPGFLAEPEEAITGYGSFDNIATAEEITMPAKALEEKATGWWHYVRVMAITIAVVVCLRVFIFDVVQVNGGSMIPTLHNTDSLISSKIAYRLNDPQRFDIVLLDAPDQSGYFIKRVIGLPNERIEIRSGMVFINGELLSEEYLNNIYTDGDTDTVIPEGCYFVMGDNRPISRDSRSDSIRNIAKEHIKGKAIFRFYPFSSFKIL